MANIVLDMSMSLDGFIAGPDDSVEHGLGRDGLLLHDWLAEGGIDPRSYQPSDGPSAQVFAEVMATGAVITGRRTFEHGGEWNGDHHDGVPIFVLTREAPDREPPGHAQYVTDVDDCADRAKAAAGDRDIMMHGASAAQAFLRAGRLDELEIHVIPVLLGEGRRLFEGLGSEHIELTATRVLEAPGVTHLRYRVG